MLGMKNETCKIVMFYEIIDFRNIVIKSFFKNNESENVTDMKNEKNIDHINEILFSDDEISRNLGFKKISQTHVDEKEISNSFSAFKRDRDRSKKLSLRFRDFETNISIFFQGDLQNDLLTQNMQISISISISISLVKSRCRGIECMS